MYEIFENTDLNIAERFLLDVSNTRVITVLFYILASPK